jgi:hypothetical protein
LNPDLHMQKTQKTNGDSHSTHSIGGAHAILGMDVVSFSKLHDDDQIKTMQQLSEWTNAALQYSGITQEQYRWSPAGDGGYLTFGQTSACRKAVDVAFSIFEKAKEPQFRARHGERLQLRLVLHAGTVQEAPEFGQKTNIWGWGINLTARLLSLANPSQLLMSRQYFDLYVKDQREAEFEISEFHWRTVKHDVQLEVVNVGKGNLCLSKELAKALRWQHISGLWRDTVTEYRYLMNDALRSGDSMAALAAARYLLDLKEPEALTDLAVRIGVSERKPSKPYALRDTSIFSQMPAQTLQQVIESSKPEIFSKDKIICKHGDTADSCFFVVAGAVAVEIPGQPVPTTLSTGEIIGEFSLWIPTITRTATLRAAEECLLLTISNDRFAKILKQDQHVAEQIYGRVKDRILTNIRKSPELFPRDVLPQVAEIPVKCELLARGTKLNLRNSLYVMFNGSVNIEPPGKGELTVKASGNFGPDTVVGIVSDLGNSDGDTAYVQEETVAAVFPRAAIRAMQEGSDEMSDLWNAIWGRRQGKMLRRPLDLKSAEPEITLAARSKRASYQD